MLQPRLLGIVARVIANTDQNQQFTVFQERHLVITWAYATCQQPAHNMATTWRNLSPTCALPGATWVFTGFSEKLAILKHLFEFSKIVSVLNYFTRIVK